MDNAEALDSFPLRQTIASALPPPGYSKTRPHVFALSLPNGAVHLFQVGTPDIVREFVCTTNYWSARLSKEPLTGGVSSMEYGWGENVINPALIRQDSSPSVQGHMPRPSVTSSLRSSMDHATGTPKPRLPGDKINLSDWSPPACSMMASSLMEVDQLRALIDYVKNIEGELGYHNELRTPLLIAVRLTPSAIHMYTNDMIVLSPPPQRRTSHGQLGTQVSIPPPRNRQVPHIYRYPHRRASLEAEDLRRARGTRGA
jgi:hypothetical protein